MTKHTLKTTRVFAKQGFSSILNHFSTLYIKGLNLYLFTLSTKDPSLLQNA